VTTISSRKLGPFATTLVPYQQFYIDVEIPRDADFDWNEFNVSGAENVWFRVRFGEMGVYLAGGWFPLESFGPIKSYSFLFRRGTQVRFELEERGGKEASPSIGLKGLAYTASPEVLRSQALIEAVRKHFKVSNLIFLPQSTVGDFGEHMSDPDFYAALKEISREVGYEVKETHPIARVKPADTGLGLVGKDEGEK
jgi:hypothetical protein